eukprot:COSAG01_NODE_10176_length_2230_cov_1.879869_1_plen_34_part_10
MHDGCCMLLHAGLDPWLLSPAATSRRAAAGCRVR